MTGLFPFIYLLLLLAIICLPAILLAKLKNIYDSTFEAVLMGSIVGFCQFFLVALGLFYCKVPVSLAGWVIAYLGNILLTIVLLKTIKQGAGEAGFKQDKVFWIYIGIVCVVLLAFILQTMRSTGIASDSAYHWFLRGWVFADSKDIYAFRYVSITIYPLIVPLIYSFFLQTHCALGVAGYTAVLMSVFILIILVAGWKRAGKLSMIIGVPLSVYMPVFFNDHYYTSYADIPFAIVFCAALVCLSDSIFKKKTVYPAAVLLSALVLIRANGTMLVLVTALVTLLYTYHKESVFKNMFIETFKLFVIPLMVIIMFNRILKCNNAPSEFNRTFMPTIMNEFVNTPDRFVYMWEKLKLIVSYYADTGRAVPYNYIYFSPLLFILVFWRLRRSEAFMLLVVLCNMFIYVVPMCMAIAYAELPHWFSYGFTRQLFHFMPALMAGLFFVCLDFMNKIKNIHKE